MPVAGSAIHTLASIFVDPFLLPMIRRIMFSPQEVPEGYDSRVRGSAPDVMLLAEGDDAALMVPEIALNLVLYAKCSVPVVVVVGTADRIVENRRHGRVLPAVTPDASYVELPGIGRMAHHFGQTEILRAVERIASR
jgi:pimeloyl-ACP methyl ester carboxylesterase